MLVQRSLVSACLCKSVCEGTSAASHLGPHVRPIERMCVCVFLSVCV